MFSVENRLRKSRSGVMTRLLAAWAGWAIAGGVAVAAGGRGEVIEPKTGFSFPIQIKPVGGEGYHTLTGVGVRTRTFLALKVYAMGIYVDAPKAAEALKRWRGKSAAELRRDKPFYAALLQDDFAKTLRMKMARDVDGEDMREAFEEQLLPRVRRAARDWGLAGGEQAVRQFRTFFSADEIREGTELVFTWHPGGRLASRVGTRQNPTVPNLALCWALFDVYLGSDPIEPEAKARFVDRFPALLAAPSRSGR